MSSGFSEDRQAGFDAEPNEQRSKSATSATVRLGPGGRVVIPAEMREAMGVKQGDAMLATLNNAHELTLVTFDARVRELQAITRKYHPEGVSLADELIAERRAEAAREDEES